MTISSLGIGSGFDFETMVTGLLDAEFQVPTINLERERDQLTSRLSAVGVMKNAMEEFEEVVDNLGKETTFDKRSATTADNTKFTISVTDGAPIGVFGIEVKQLAQAHKLRLDLAGGSSTTTIGDGTLTFTIGSSSFNINVTAGNDTAQDIVNSINNATDNVGVSASILDTDAGASIIFTSNNSGVSNAMQITVSDNDGDNTNTAGLSQLVYDGTTQNMTQTDAALDAMIEVDGQQVSNASNAFSNVLTGTTITAIAVETTPGTRTNASILQDTQGVQADLESFIDKYNAIVTAVDTYASYNEEDQSIGILFGDATTRTFYSIFTKTATEEVSSMTEEYRSLAAIGITRDRNGLLSISSSTTLTQALSNDMATLKKMFTNTTDGLAVRLENLMDDYVNADGVYRQKELSISEEIRQNLIEFEDLQSRYILREETLRARFSLLDANLAQLDAVSSLVESSIDSINSSNGSKK